MREVNNDKPNSAFNFTEIQRSAQPQDEQLPASPAQVPAQEAKGQSDLSAMPTAFLGQSQVTSDSIRGDMKFLEKNPALAAAIVQAVDNYAKTHTYEQTLQFLEKAHQELANKK